MRTDKRNRTTQAEQGQQQQQPSHSCTDNLTCYGLVVTQVTQVVTGGNDNCVTSIGPKAV